MFAPSLTTISFLHVYSTMYYHIFLPTPSITSIYFYQLHCLLLYLTATSITYILPYLSTNSITNILPYFPTNPIIYFHVSLPTLSLTPIHCTVHPNSLLYPLPLCCKHNRQKRPVNKDRQRCEIKPFSDDRNKQNYIVV